MGIKVARYSNTKNDKYTTNDEIEKLILQAKRYTDPETGKYNYYSDVDVADFPLFTHRYTDNSVDLIKSWRDIYYPRNKLYSIQVKNLPKRLLDKLLKQKVSNVETNTRNDISLDTYLVYDSTGRNLSYNELKHLLQNFPDYAKDYVRIEDKDAVSDFIDLYDPRDVLYENVQKANNKRYQTSYERYFNQQKEKGNDLLISTPFAVPSPEALNANVVETGSNKENFYINVGTSENAPLLTGTHVGVPGGTGTMSPAVLAGPKINLAPPNFQGVYTNYPYDFGYTDYEFEPIELEPIPTTTFNSLPMNWGFNLNYRDYDWDDDEEKKLMLLIPQQYPDYMKYLIPYMFSDLREKPFKKEDGKEIKVKLMALGGDTLKPKRKLIDIAAMFAQPDLYEGEIEDIDFIKELFEPLGIRHNSIGNVPPEEAHKYTIKRFDEGGALVVDNGDTLIDDLDWNTYAQQKFSEYENYLIVPDLTEEELNVFDDGGLEDIIEYPTTFMSEYVPDIYSPSDKLQQSNDALKYAVKYTNSAGFKQRLLKAQGYLDNFINSEYDPYWGLSNKRTLTFNGLPSSLSTIREDDLLIDNANYNPSNHNINIGTYTSNNGYGVNYNNTAAHELGHAIANGFAINLNDYNNKPATLISYPNIFPVFRRNKLYTDYLNQPNTDQDLLSTLPNIYNERYPNSKSLHDALPDESYADLLKLRNELNKYGIYDSTLENNIANQEVIDNYKKAVGNEKLNRLFKNFTDLDIIEMLNEVAYNNALNNNIENLYNLACKGGKINKFEPGGFVYIPNNQQNMVVNPFEFEGIRYGWLPNGGTGEDVYKEHNDRNGVYVRWDNDNNKWAKTTVSRDLGNIKNYFANKHDELATYDDNAPAANAYDSYNNPSISAQLNNLFNNDPVIKELRRRFNDMAVANRTLGRNNWWEGVGIAMTPFNLVMPSNVYGAIAKLFLDLNEYASAKRENRIPNINGNFFDYLLGGNNLGFAQTTQGTRDWAEQHPYLNMGINLVGDAITGYGIAKGIKAAKVNNSNVPYIPLTVDENGNMLMAHGSPNKNINKFKIDLNRNRGFNDGIYFTDPETAKQYTGTFGRGKIYEVEYPYNNKNVAVIEGNNNSWAKIPEQSAANGLGISTDELHNIIGFYNDARILPFSKKPNYYAIDLLVKAAREKGFDAVHFKQVKDRGKRMFGKNRTQDLFVALDPEDVIPKSIKTPQRSKISFKFPDEEIKTFNLNKPQNERDFYDAVRNLGRQEIGTEAVINGDYGKMKLIGVPERITNKAADLIFQRVAEYNPEFIDNTKSIIKNHDRAVLIDKPLMKNYMPNTDGFTWNIDPFSPIALRGPKSSTETFLHELRHKLLSRLKLTDEQKTILENAYEGIEPVERESTNTELRANLLPDEISKENINIQNEYIENIPDAKLIQALHNINGYGQEYVGNILENARWNIKNIDPWIPESIKKALKYVPAATGVAYGIGTTQQ